MKTFKLMLGIVAMCLGLSAHAQQTLSQDMTITKPIYFMKAGENPLKMDPANDKCTLRFFKFKGGFITYDLEISGPTIKKILQDSGEKVEKMNFTWTGNVDRVANAPCINAISSKNKGLPMYFVSTPSQQMDGFLAQQQEGWMVLISGQIKFISGISTGMTLSEIKAKLKGMTNLVNIEKSGTDGTMTIYTLYGARLKNDPYKRNTSQVTKDDAYAHFYMDANGKLVKWYMVKKF